MTMKPQSKTMTDRLLRAAGRLLRAAGPWMVSAAVLALAGGSACLADTATWTAGRDAEAPGARPPGGPGRPIAPGSLDSSPSPTGPDGPLSEVGIDQNLGGQLPLDLLFRDEEGREVRLGDYFGRRPVLLSFVYFNCPMLCSYVLEGQLKSMRALSFTAGDQFEVITVSFDPADTPERARSFKEDYAGRYDREEAAAGWHFLTGPPEAIGALTAAAGFRYKRDPESGEFAHAAGAMVVTPKGVLARYLLGIEYSARDLKFALMDASGNRIGSPVEKVLLYCFHYDPTTGRYSMAIMNILRVAGLLTVAALGLSVFLMTRRSRRGAAAGGGRASSP